MPQYKFDTPALKGAKSSISQAMKKRTEDRRKKEKEQFSKNPPLKKMKYSEQMKERMKAKEDKRSYSPTQPDDGKYNRKGVEYQEDSSIEGPEVIGIKEYRRQLKKKYPFMKVKDFKQETTL